MTTKIDWKATDYVNYTDFNRIVENILMLKELAWLEVGDIPIASMETYSMGDTPTLETYQAIENNIALINKRTLGAEYQKKDFGSFSPTNLYIKAWDYNDLNRIEGMIKQIYDYLPKPISENLLTEDGTELLTENGENLVTEGV